MKLTNRRVRRTLCTSIAALVALPLAIRAASYTWTGGGTNSNWSNASNWLGGAPSPSATNNSLTFAGSTRVSNTIDSAQAFQVMSLTFAGNSAAFTISGSTLQFQTGGAAPTLVMSSAANQTINSAVTLANDLTISGVGTGQLTFGGSVGGTGGLIKTSAGALSFGGAVSIGSIDVNAGSVTFASGSSSANSLIRVAGGASFTLNGGSVNTGSNSYFQVGSSSGSASATLNSGSVTSTETDIGNVAGATGSVTQNGGTHAVTGRLYLGVNATSIGNYTLNSGGTLNTNGTTVGHNGSGVFTQNGGAHTSTGAVYLGSQGANTTSGVYNLNGGVLTTPEVSSNANTASTSTFNFNGGTLRASGATAVLMHGLTVANIQAGGAVIDTNGFNATMAQGLQHASALGSASDGGLTKIGAGKLTLTGASNFTGSTFVNAGTLEIGNGGSILNSFPQIAPGGTLLVSPGGSYNTGSGVFFSVGSSAGASPATVQQTGGAVQTVALDVGNAPGSTGVYNQSGGTNTVSTQFTVGLNAGATGTYNLSGTGALNLPSVSLVGVHSTGTFNQTGGTVTAGQVNIGYHADGVGIYLMSAGQFSASNFLLVGNNGSGVVKQSGGSISSPSLIYLGYANSASTGAYELSGGVVSTSSLVLGYSGSGTVTQTGGLMSVTAAVLGQAAGSSGVYRLGGGVLRAGSVTGGSGASTFTFDGGTLQAAAASGNLITGVNTLQVLAGGAKIDTNGFSVTIGANLAHDVSEPGGLTVDGGLTKLGAGNLTLTAANSFNGGVTVAGGALTVANDGNLGASSGPVTLMNGGKLSFSGSTFSTGRSFTLNNATLSPPANGTITYNGASIFGGYLGSNGASTHQLAGNASITGSTVLPGTAVSQASGTSTLDTVTFSGALNQSAGAVLNFRNGYISAAGAVTAGGTMNTSNVEVVGRVSISGALNNTGSPLVFGYGSAVGVSNGGHLNAGAGAAIELNGARLDNNGSITGSLNINQGSLATGGGSFGAATVRAGGALSPGSSVGVSGFTSLTLDAGSTFRLELNSGVPNPGVNQDLINVNGSLTLGSGGPITLRLVSLTADGEPGLLSGFSSNAPQSFVIANSTAAISGFSANQFIVDTSDFVNGTSGGFFAVQESADQRSLILAYTPIPEPGAASLLVAGTAALGMRRFRRRVGAA